MGSLGNVGRVEDPVKPAPDCKVQLFQYHLLLIRKILDSF